MIKLNEQPQAVIMLVEGAAIGGGLGLVLRWRCHHRNPERQISSL